HAPLQPLPEAREAASLSALMETQAQQGAWPQAQWWQQLGDPQLTALVEEGLENNPDMDAAMARIEAAQAATTLAGAARTPSVDINASIQRSQLSSTGLFPPPI